MSKNPFANASAAVSYIILVALVMNYGSKHAGPQDSVLLPIAFLSLFVLSAATMGYVFLYRPVLMYVEGEKQEAVKLFLRTLAVFAAFTVAILTFVFFVIV